MFSRRLLLGILLSAPVAWFIPGSIKERLYPDAKYKDFLGYLDDIKDYARQQKGSEVLCNDNPLKRELGFTVVRPDGSEKDFQVRLTRAKALIAAIEGEEKKQLITRAIVSLEGRKALALSIEAQAYEEAKALEGPEVSRRDFLS
jgi:hypothetical protein